MSLSWGARRQLLYMGLLVVVGLAILAYIFVPKILTKPTCFDGKKNGAEAGIDCGGECQKICINDAAPLSVIWSRVFLTTGNIYNAVAYVENRNANAVVANAHYQFKIFDDKDILITTKEGTIDIPPAGRYPVFVGGIDMGNRHPTRTKFDFIDPQPNLIRIDTEKIDIFHSLLAKNPEFSDLSTSPKLHAVLQNNNLYDINDVSVVALVSDENNVIAVSSTHLNYLGARSIKDLYFNWPIPFSTNPLHIELVPMFDLINTDFSKNANGNN